MKPFINLLLLTLIFGHACYAQNRPKDNATVLIDPNNTMLRAQLESLVKSFNAKIGIAVMCLEDGDTLTINNDHHYPMQSTYKFPLAMAVLQQVDKGKLALNQKMRVNKTDIRKTWRFIQEKYPDGNVDITIAELLKYSVSLSDNIACDILFRAIKGTAIADQYVKQLGVKNMAIKATEKEMAASGKVQYTNYSTPYAMVQLLDIFHSKEKLSAASTDFLMDLMIQSSNSTKRIKGALPPEAIVAHKTGTSGTNNDGLTAAINDVGIVTLPDGKHFAIAVFVSDSKEPMEHNEKIIALVSATVYNTLGIRSVGKK
ncbi:MAG: class A beta-lactamase, subclass A2 [Taibaiella sp.]|jgi:beta-lactamase class A